MNAVYDLGRVFDEHVASEFESKDIDATMSTMIAEPYVWHVPTLEGASGGPAVRQFYTSQFIGHTPADVRLQSVSRTIGTDRVIDEAVMEFTHDSEVPFMLPGVRPTGHRAQVPMVVIMGFEGDKVAYEHIYWDQATVLVQLGLLDGSGLPVAGSEEAARLLELARTRSRPGGMS